MRNTISMTVKHSPAQLVFNKHMIMRMKYKVDWNKTTENRNLISTKSNKTENIKRLNHKYRVMDYVLIFKSPDERRRQRKIGDPVTEGPFHITKTHRNGTIGIRRGNVIENISIRPVKPYKRKTRANN